MIKLETSRFGTIEVSEERVFNVPSGMIGFPDYTRYALLDHQEGSPFLWFQSIENGSLAFVLIDPLLFKPDYQVEIGREDMEELGLTNGCKPMHSLVVINVTRGNGARLTANLLGPVVLNVEKRLAKQVALTHPDYAIRHPIPTASIGS
jgi:flagellar assembly factor FliW